MAARFPNARILTAASGDFALELLKEERASLILADYRMRGMDGIDFLRRSQAVAPEAARLMLTAYSDAGLIERALNETDASYVVAKPFDPQDLLAIVQTLLQAKSGTGDPSRGPAPEEPNVDPDVPS